MLLKTYFLFLSRIFRSPLLVLILVLAFLHALLIWRYSIDIPYADEWELFKPNSFLINPSWASLFAQHNEHRLVLPKLVFSLYYNLIDFNIPIASMINYLVFAITFGLFFRFSFLKTHQVFFALIALMAFSPLNFENHLWVFQIQWHLFLLFLVLSCHLLSKYEISPKSLIWFFLLPLAMIYTLGSGLAAALTFISLITLKLIFVKERQITKLASLIFLFAAGAALVLYFIGYVKPTYHPPFSFPFTLAFWDHFSAIISLGFGNRSHIVKPVSVVFLIAHILIGFQIMRTWPIASVRHRFLFLLASTLVAVLASISVSRAGLGADQAFSSRYFEYSSFYLITVLAMSFEKLSEKKRTYGIVIGLLLTITTLRSYRDDDYILMYRQRERGLICLKNSIAMNSNVICPEIYPLAPLNDIIKELKAGNLNLSFLKKLN